MKKLSNSLFWRLSIFFVIFLLITSAIYMYFTYNASLNYSQETTQRLNRSLAERIATHTKAFVNGNIDQKEVEDIFHNVMVLNPSVEVYLLDNNGQILSYYAPFGKVKLNKLNLSPIHKFIENKDIFIKGEDPRNPGQYKIFSAAKMINNGKQVGYIYTILSSEEVTNIADMLAKSYQIKLISKSLIFTFLAALLIGFLIIWYLTKNLNHIISVVNKFKNGDLNARINLKSKGELSSLANHIDSMADTIVKNINEIKSVEKLRKELITNISHDLRTPLTSIQGYAETLVMMGEQLDIPTKQKYLDTILTSTHRVKKLVDDLFEISKLEANQVKTKKEIFSINELLSDIVMNYKLIAKSKSIDFNVEIPNKNIMVYADLSLIDRVFHNLLDNALKHTPPGGKVFISVKQKKNEMVEIIIKDTGIGIAKEELPFIFDRYRKSKENKKEGTGLGLAIVKKILELHKTDIKVVSDTNKGTSFYFTLPVNS